MKLEVLAKAKINLALSIEGKRADGYHEVHTVMQSVALSDSLIIEESKRLSLRCSREDLACDESNLVLKAAHALQAYTKTNKGAALYLQKRIPMAAGLAGGSSDAAATLRGLNQFWELGLSMEELRTIGRTLGADVPFCIEGGTALGRGRGDALSYLPDMPETWIFIANPPISVSTVEAYALYKQENPYSPVPVQAMCEAIETGDWEKVKPLLGNTFEELQLPKLTEVAQCKQVLEEKGVRTLMTGSGPTLYGFISDPMFGYTIQDELREAGFDWDFRITRTTQRGAVLHGKG